MDKTQNLTQTMPPISTESPTVPATPGEVQSEFNVSDFVVENLPPAHHKFGPSSLKNREICAGWKNDQSSDKSRADEGTKLHLAFENRDLAGLDAEQAEQVQKCINYVAPLEKNALIIIREARLKVLPNPETGKEQTFGTADLVILRRLANGKLHIDVVDEKYGWNPVDDAKENRQGFSYVLGAWELPGEWRQAESCTMHFLSPRIDDVSRHTFFKRDIPRLSLTVSSIIAKAEHWDKTRDPSMLVLNETNCTWCGRKATCPAMINYGIAHAKKYKPLEIAEETHSSTITDPVKMGQFYIALKVLEKLVDSGKKHVAAFTLENDIPGFSRRERKGKVTITNSVSAWPVLLKKFGITSLDDPAIADLINCATFSYADITKFVSDKAGKGKAKTEAVGRLWTDLQDVEAVFQSEPSAYLQRDKEEAVLDVIATPVVEAEPQTLESRVAAIEAKIPDHVSCVQGAAVD
jgi:hypothetical protein